MIFHILAILILSGAAGWLYWAGGSSKYPFWFREVGMTLTVVLGLLSLQQFSWELIIVAGLTYGAQTTYFKKKGEDAEWWNWLLVGLAFSLVVLPIVVVKHLWIGFYIRTLLVTMFTDAWSSLIGKDWLEEGGRGAIQVLSLPLLLIGA